MPAGQAMVSGTFGAQFRTYLTYSHARPKLTYSGLWDCVALDRVRSLVISAGRSRETMIRTRSNPTAFSVGEDPVMQGHEKNDEIVSNGNIGRRLLKVEDAAEFLGLSVDTLHKWVQERSISHVKAGRALRFDVKALERYIEQHTIKPIE